MTTPSLIRKGHMIFAPNPITVFFFSSVLCVGRINLLSNLFATQNISSKFVKGPLLTAPYWSYWVHGRPSLARRVRGLNLSMAMGLTPSNIIPARRGYVPYASASDFWPTLGFVFTSLNFLLSSFGFGALELLNVFLSVSSPCEVLWDGREPRWPMARARARPKPRALFTRFVVVTY